MLSFYKLIAGLETKISVSDIEFGGIDFDPKTEPVPVGSVWYRANRKLFGLTPDALLQLEKQFDFKTGWRATSIKCPFTNTTIPLTDLQNIADGYATSEKLSDADIQACICTFMATKLLSDVAIGREAEFVAAATMPVDRAPVVDVLHSPLNYLAELDVLVHVKRGELAEFPTGYAEGEPGMHDFTKLNLSNMFPALVDIFLKSIARLANAARPDGHRLSRRVFSSIDLSNSGLIDFPGKLLLPWISSGIQTLFIADNPGFRLTGIGTGLPRLSVLNMSHTNPENVLKVPEFLKMHKALRHIIALGMPKGVPSKWAVRSDILSATYGELTTRMGSLLCSLMADDLTIFDPHINENLLRWLLAFAPVVVTIGGGSDARVTSIVDNYRAQTDTHV